MAHWIAETAALMRFYPWRHLWLRWVRCCALICGICTILILLFGHQQELGPTMYLLLLFGAIFLRRYLPAGVPDRMYGAGMLGFILVMAGSMIGFGFSVIAYLFAWDPLAFLRQGWLNVWMGLDILPVLLPVSGALAVGLAHGLVLRHDIPGVPVWEWIVVDLGSFCLADAVYAWGQTAFGGNWLVTLVAALGAGVILGAIPGLAMVRLVGLYLPNARQGGHSAERRTLTLARN